MMKMSSRRERDIKKKIDAIDEASSIRVNGDEIEKKKKEEDEDIVVQPPNPDQVISQSYVLISDSDASREKPEGLERSSGASSSGNSFGTYRDQVEPKLRGNCFTNARLGRRLTCSCGSSGRALSLQGDQERSRGLYKTALLHSEGERP